MTKQIEKDELLMALKKSTKLKAAPKLDDQILINASVSTSKSGKPRKIAFSALGGVAALVIVAGVTFTLTPKATNNGGSSDMSYLRVWIPDVSATAGQNLSNTSDWNAATYRSVGATTTSTYVNLLADYFDLHGEITQLHTWMEDATNQSDLFELEDKEKKATLSVFDSPVIRFSLELNPENKSGEITSKEEAVVKLSEILKDLKSRFQPTDVLAIEFSDVEVTYRENLVFANVNQIVDGHEVPLGVSATFGKGGELTHLSASIGVFAKQGTVETLPEAQAVSRLGAFYDNPFRVGVLGETLTDWNLYCENSPKYNLGNDCITTVDEVVKGYGVTTSADGATLLVPSYSMYHDGKFIGAVSAVPGEHPQK